MIYNFNVSSTSSWILNCDIKLNILLFLAFCSILCSKKLSTSYCYTYGKVRLKVCGEQTLPIPFQFEFEFEQTLPIPAQYQYPGAGIQTLKLHLQNEGLSLDFSACPFHKLSFYPWRVTLAKKKNFFFRQIFHKTGSVDNVLTLRPAVQCVVTVAASLQRRD